MAVKKIVYALFVTMMAASLGPSAQGPSGEQNLPAQGTASVEAFLGSWDLTVDTPQMEYASWLGIGQENGKLTGQFVGRLGSSLPVDKIEIENGLLTFLAPKGMVFKGRLIGDLLSGSTAGPDGTPWVWTGRRMPGLKRTADPQWGKPVSLFNGKDLTGWRFTDPDKRAIWGVRNGTIVVSGGGTELVSTCTFEDFKLHVEFNMQPKANSGVFLRGRYEIQIESDAGQKAPSHHTGAVYSLLAPTPELPRVTGKWQSFDITLVGRVVTVVQNGQTIIAAQEIPSITGGALDSHEDMPGPIYLQGSEKGGVAFRNIVITPARE
jgi:hypothetical protein